jgi:hypothetical protein
MCPEMVSWLSHLSSWRGAPPGDGLLDGVGARSWCPRPALAPAGDEHVFGVGAGRRVRRRVTWLSRCARRCSGGARCSGQLVLAEDPRRVGGEGDQQLELQTAEPHSRSGDGDRPGGAVDADLVDVQVAPRTVLLGKLWES